MMSLYKLAVCSLRLSYFRNQGLSSTREISIPAIGTMAVPSTHRALTVVERGDRETNKPGRVDVRERPVPALKEDGVLVRVKSVALNPTDWKHLDWLLPEGASIGCDFAGTVAAVGEKAKDAGFKIGDDVAGFVRGGSIDKDNGAFQEYVSTPPQLIWHKPASLPYGDAAPMGGIALSTAVQAIFHRFKTPYTGIDKPEPFLVWAGSTGVGMYAIKVASLLGYRVVTTASPHNFELVKSLGASAVFDYKDPDVSMKIQEWVKDQKIGPLTKGLDTISESKDSTAANGAVIGSSIKLSLQSFGDSKRRLVTLLPPAPEFKEGTDPILVYSALKPQNDDFGLMAEWYKLLPSWIQEGKLGAGVVPLNKQFSGLEELGSALDFVRQGRVSGHKVVVAIDSETK